jgi:hypothetical protein
VNLQRVPREIHMLRYALHRSSTEFSIPRMPVSLKLLHIYLLHTEDNTELRTYEHINKIIYQMEWLEHLERIPKNWIPKLIYRQILKSKLDETWSTKDGTISSLVTGTNWRGSRKKALVAKSGYWEKPQKLAVRIACIPGWNLNKAPSEYKLRA